MNLCILKKSRATPKSSAIFVWQLQQMPDRFYWGMIVSTNASVGGFENTILIYMYNIHTKNKSRVPVLSASQLLVPPMATNRLPWSRGYFETVGHQKIEPADLLPRHIFFCSVENKYFDDHGVVVDTIGSTPVGIYGLHSYRTIDDEISETLGIPLAPD